MNIKDYIESGVLELFVLGQTSEEENFEIASLRNDNPEIESEIRIIQNTVEQLALKNSIEPHPALRPLVLATFNYIKRLESGEEMCFPPILNKNSKIEDFSEWIDRENMQAPLDFDDMHANIISATPEMTCAIVWIKKMAPEEVHHDEHEKFLILEGTCTIVVGTKENKLKPGDFFQIPLYEDHQVIVTSAIPCKVILQRIAA